jgi:hypothetical protein
MGLMEWRIEINDGRSGLHRWIFMIACDRQAMYILSLVTAI